MTVLIIAVIAALLLSFVCSIAEATLLSLSPGQIASLIERRPRAGKIWKSFKRNIDRPVAVILMVNTAAHTIGAATAGAQFAALYGSDHVVLFSLLFTLVMFQLTEIAPKTLGVRHAPAMAVILARPLAWAVWLCSPILALVQILNRPFSGPRSGREVPIPIEEITALAATACLSSVITPEQERIIFGAARLSSLSARDVMTPVSEATFLSRDQTRGEALTSLRSRPQKRSAVTEGDQGDVLGYVNFNELVYSSGVSPSGEDDLSRLIRPIRPVPAATPVPELLNLFVNEQVAMVVVREGDETIGILTIEDIVEELVDERPAPSPHERVPLMRALQS
jgi:putative hemolysin